MEFLKQLINGLSIGSIYALVALGYTMVYGIVKLINFAHGDIIMVGSYIILVTMNNMWKIGVPFWLAIIISMIFCAILGIVIERLAYKPLRNAPRITVLITAIGVSLLLQNVFMLVFGSGSISFPQVLQGTVDFFGIAIGKNTLVTIFLSIFLMIVLTLFIKKTKIGKAMLAVSEDAGASTLMGINANTTISITFAIGSAIAVVGGALYSSQYPLTNPYMGSLFGLKAFIAAVLGGIGIIPGAMLGGFIMGIIESLTRAYIEPLTGGLITSQFTDAVVFSILIIVLIFKPSGILGKNIREKV